MAIVSVGISTDVVATVEAERVMARSEPRVMRDAAGAGLHPVAVVPLEQIAEAQPLRGAQAGIREVRALIGAVGRFRRFLAMPSLQACEKIRRYESKHSPEAAVPHHAS
jgi:hypothetical protein